MMLALMGAVGCSGISSPTGIATQALTCGIGKTLCNCGCTEACFPTGVAGANSCHNYCNNAACGGVGGTTSGGGTTGGGSSPDLGVAGPPPIATCPSTSENFSFRGNPPAGTTQPVGATPGSFAVSNDGDATYAVPIEVPPGRVGMQPRLTVTFDSSKGLGLLGKGFALGGMASVERCASTMAQDGMIRGVRYDSLDRFCLGGARLVATGATGSDPVTGDATTEYRTFPDSFKKVVAHVAAGASSASGPSSFVAFDSDGHIETYGFAPLASGTGAAPVNASWLVSQISDRRGNTVTYNYGSTSGTDSAGHTITNEYWPMEIDYTGGLSAPNKAVIFDYAPQTRISTGGTTVPLLNQSGFRGGNPVARTKLLTGIRTTLSGALVRQYQFTYHASASTSWPLLDSITECAAGVCLPATKFTWNDNQATGKLTKSSLTFPAASTPMTTNDCTQNPPPFTIVAATQWTAADVNGDGLVDLISSTSAGCDTQVNAGTNVWSVALNRGGGSFYAFGRSGRVFRFPTTRSIIPTARVVSGKSRRSTSTKTATWT